MNADTLLFFQGHAEALPLYEQFEQALLERIPGTTIRVSKTQISFYNRRSFGAVSFNPVRRAAERPPVWFTVTFGLNERKKSPRIDAAIEPYPNRWTHHVLISSIEDIDEELLGWLEEAAVFSAAKR